MPVEVNIKANQTNTVYTEYRTAKLGLRYRGAAGCHWLPKDQWSKRQYAGRRARVQLVANRKGVAPAGHVLRDLVDFSNMLPTSALRAADPQQSEEPHDLYTSRKFFN